MKVQVKFTIDVHDNADFEELRKLVKEELDTTVFDSVEDVRIGVFTNLTVWPWEKAAK